jgi:capsular polysaccharide biosynthesis protein
MGIVARLSDVIRLWRKLVLIVLFRFLDYFVEHFHANRSSINHLLNALSACTFSTKKIVSVRALEVSRIENAEIVYVEAATVSSARLQYFYQQQKLERMREFDVHVLSMKESMVFGSSNVVVANGEVAIYEALSFDTKNKFLYSDSCVLTWKDNSLLLQYKDSHVVIEDGIMLSGNYSWNYYHFLFEFMTKFYLIDRSQIDVNVPIIVDIVVQDVPQYLELLSLLNADNRTLVFIRKGYGYHVRHLYYVSMLNVIPPNYRALGLAEYCDTQFNTESIGYLRDRLVKKAMPSKHKKRLFLSRRNASLRRQYNEGQVIEIVLKYDFEVVCPEEYSVSEQVSMFNGADFVAGATGAAFSNILFCKKRCKILCLQSTEIDISAFATIAKYLELDMQYYVSNTYPQVSRQLHGGFNVDCHVLEQILIEFLEKR